ncbi:MAG: DsrE family protein [Candidatus Hydrothermarchaeota archaeon]
MGKKVLTIITRAPYGSEDNFGALDMISTAPAADLEAEVIFLGGGVHSTVKGQEPGYGPLAIWRKGIPSVEDRINNAKEFGVKISVLDRDLKRRGIGEEELISGIDIISLEEVTDKILESDATFVF